VYTDKSFKTTLGFRVFNTPLSLGNFINSPTQLLETPSQGNGNTGTLGILSADIRGERATRWESFSRTFFIQNEYTSKTNLSLFSRVQYRETGLSDRSYSYLTTDGNVVSRAIRAHYSNRIAGEILANYTLGEYQRLTGGIQFSQDNLELNYRGINPDNRVDTIDHIPVKDIYATFKPREYTIQNNTGIYVQYVLRSALLNKTNLTVGIRYDYNSVYGATINPRLGVINQPNEKIVLKFLLGSAFRAPTNFELYSTVPVRVSNPDLKPEKIRTYEFNFIYKPSEFFLLQTNLFENDLLDLIVADVPIGAGLIQNQNLGRATIRGLEAKVDAIFSTSFSGFLNFTFQEGTQNNGVEDLDMANIAKIKGNAGLSIHVAGLLCVSVIENFVEERSVPKTNPLGKVGDYFVTNLVISTTKLFHNHVSASLNIRNLTDREYIDPGIRSADGNLFSTVLEQPGINGFFKISVSLY